MMKTLILLMLLSATALAAEPPTNPRFAEIEKERVDLQKQIQTAQLLFENAQLKLDKLKQEEKQLAEKKEDKGK